MVITAICGKSIFKNLCNKYGLKITVCHYPPGASKWNPIEHRLFSEITKIGSVRFRRPEKKGYKS